MIRGVLALAYRIHLSPPEPWFDPNLQFSVKWNETDAKNKSNKNLGQIASEYFEARGFCFESNQNALELSSQLNSEIPGHSLMKLRWLQY